MLLDFERLEFFMVAEHWLLTVLLLILPVSTLSLAMVEPTPLLGSTTIGSSTDGSVLGNFFRLQPPAVTEVTCDNFHDWSYKMKNYVSTLDYRLGRILSSWF